MQYVRDIPRNDPAALEQERAHVIAHLSAVASADDDPETNADDVRVTVIDHPERADLLRIVGDLDAQPDAPYLRADFNPLAGVDPALYEAEVAAAVRDEEVLRGQA